MTLSCELSGKLPPEMLKKCVFPFTGCPREDLVVGPSVGEDAAVIRWPQGKYLVFTSDPIVGASKGAGKLLVRVNANDVASKGGEPMFLGVTMIVPPPLGLSLASELMEEIHRECCAMGIAVAGGHTEINDRYDSPVLMGAMIGSADRVLRASDVRPGHRLIVTKHLGIEGMSILAQDRRDLLLSCLSEEEVRRAASWGDLTSVLPEAMALRDLADFMHDPTEGGFLGGLSEVESLVGLKVQLDRSKLPVDSITVKASSALGFDPLCLISSGSLMAFVSDERIEEAQERLSRTGCPFAVVGTVSDEPFDGVVSVKEELWGLLKR
ncbi:LOW QUALITY PROTEIN: hydrogenase maturation factor [Thermanaerovibrio velox DSM 12556]|uniref:Hydrogenase maturation factor n=2 Tax=Thermanaerovibrio TaxID=81461 RepID=H0UQW9_9BACT|nr:LOW QUALITY PROTEIN: hydrogenase maturation factor [Thermanaerovibrio velox DSM 12556]